MGKVTALERDVLSRILSIVLPADHNAAAVLDELKIKDRVFSSQHGGYCSGFYTSFQSNFALANLKNIPHEFSVQAKCDKLSFGEMGFFVFCDSSTKSFIVMEGFFYGDDRIAVDELLNDEHSISVYTLPGL